MCVDLVPVPLTTSMFLIKVCRSRVLRVYIVIHGKRQREKYLCRGELDTCQRGNAGSSVALVVGHGSGGVDAEAAS